MVGLIAAEKMETNNLIKVIKAKIIEFNGIRYYIGDINGKQTIVCFSGVGKANAAMAAMNMVINFGVDKIFNIGLAGACKSSVYPGATIVADATEYNDVDMTSFGYQLNQLPDELIKYEIKKEYVNYLSTIVDNPIVGTVSTGDTVVSINNVEAFPTVGNKEVVAFDMEANAIAHVCYKTKTDFMCIKIVSDNLSIDQDSRKQYNTNYKNLSKKIESISLKVLEHFSIN